MQRTQLRWSINWEKLFANHIFDKALNIEYIENFVNWIIREQTIQLENGQNLGHFMKENKRMTNIHLKIGSTSLALLKCKCRLYAVLSCSVVSNSLWPYGQVPLSMEFSRQEYWSGLPFPAPGDLPYPGVESRSPALQADSLTMWAIRNINIKTRKINHRENLADYEPLITERFPNFLII